MELPKITGSIINNRLYLPGAYSDIYPEIQGINVQKLKEKHGIIDFKYLWNKTKVFYKEKILRWERVTIIDTNTNSHKERECLIKVKVLAKQWGCNSTKTARTALQTDAYENFNPKAYLDANYKKALKKENANLHDLLFVQQSIPIDNLRQLTTDEIQEAINWCDDMGGVKKKSTATTYEERIAEGSKETNYAPLIELALAKKRFSENEQNYIVEYIDQATMKRKKLNPPVMGEDLSLAYLKVKERSEKEFRPFLEVFPDYDY